MNDAWIKFKRNKGSSTAVLNHVIDVINANNSNYIKFSHLKTLLRDLSKRHWLPSYIERYTLDNFSEFTGMNIKYIECSFCGGIDVIFTREDKGVSSMDSLCSNKCRKYLRIKSKCDKSFFRYIPEKYKASEMTILLYALQRRSKTVKKLMRGIN